MSRSKTLQERALSPNYSTLECDICGSEDIDDSRGVYVCRECGIVLEIQKLQYDRPYNEDLIQYSKGSGRTQIGSIRERSTASNSRYLHRLNRENSLVCSDKKVIDNARSEILQLFSRLNLSDYNAIKEMVLVKFKQVRPLLRPGLKYRNVEKLVAILSYMCLKIRNISVNPYELIESSDITKSEFNDFILQIRRYLPEYQERNRKAYILKRISEITEHFDLGMDFYYLSQKIMYRLWNGIKNTTDDVVAGLVSSVSLLCSYPDESPISVSAICNKLNIRMSTIQAQVKRRIFERFKVNGFISLIRSSDLLRKIMERLDLIEREKSIEEKIDTDEKVDLIMGNGIQVFNKVERESYYYFSVRSLENSPLIMTLGVNDYPLYDQKKKKDECIQGNNLLDFEIFEYYPNKGPPRGEDI